VTTRPRLRVPEITPRFLVTLAVILLAVVLSVVGLQKTDTSTPSTDCGSPAGPIVKLYPCPGYSVLAQGDIGVDMSPGYMVDLYVDNTPIPDDVMTIDAGLMTFTPGPGTVTGALQPGPHTAKIVYYKSLADEADGSVYSWNFTTH
jgi:hypothetical protein